MAKLSDSARLADSIAGWLRDHLTSAGADGFVVGLSGGVDSATVCGLCCRAVDPNQVFGAIMPSHSNPRDAQDAELVARNFGVATLKVDLTPVADAVMQAVAATVEWPAHDDRRLLAAANIKPRLRMTTLYYLANLRNALVVGTGNKSEALIGYFTKYGDGGIDLLPIVDLYKHQVRELARELGVPESVIAKPPSAGLWPGQTDESEIGLSYDELDQALATIERGEFTGVAPGQLERVSSLMRDSEHKRLPVPAYRQEA